MPTGKHSKHARGARHPLWRGRAAVRETPLYRLWSNMRNRCNNVRGQDYHLYGGRGIHICARWDDFDLFAADVGPHPGYGFTLVRIDDAGDFEPGNVRWAPRTRS
jgi:hypothetical protein